MTDFSKGLETLAKYTAKPASLEGVMFANLLVAKVCAEPDKASRAVFMADPRLGEFLGVYDEIMEDLEERVMDDEFRAELSVIRRRLEEEGVV